MTKLFGRSFRFHLLDRVRTLGRDSLIAQEGKSSSKDTSLPNYSWSEIVPMMIILVVAIGVLALAPSCTDKGNCVTYSTSPDFDMNNLSSDLQAVLNNSTILTESNGNAKQTDKVEKVTEIQNDESG